MINLHNEKGFSPIEALLICIIVSILGFTGWYVWHTKQSTTKTLDAAHSQVVATKKPAQKTPTASQPTSNTATTAPSTKPTSTSTTPTTSPTNTATNTTTQSPATPATTTISEYYKVSSDGTSATETPVTTKLQNVTSVTIKLSLTCLGTCQFKLVSDNYTVADTTVYTGTQTISYTISTPGNHIFYNQYTPSTKFAVDF